MRYVCPKCGKEFEGKPNFCPHCGEKLNWPKEQPVQQPAQPKPQQQAAAPQQIRRAAPAPKMQHVDDDAPIYGYQTVRRKKKPKVYALPIKILMISFSGAVGLFSLICLLTYLGAFLKTDGYMGYGGSSASGYKLAFDFTHKHMKNAAGFIGPLLAWLMIMTIIGFSVPRILNDIKFFKAKQYTVRVERRRRKSILWLVLFGTLIFLSIILILCTKPITGASSGVDLGGGAIATVVFLFFMLGFTIAEEIIILITLRLAPKEEPYEEYQEEYIEE